MASVIDVDTTVSAKPLIGEDLSKNSNGTKVQQLHGYLITTDGRCEAKKWLRTALRADVGDATRADLETVQSRHMEYRETLTEDVVPASPLHLTPRRSFKDMYRRVSVRQGQGQEPSSLKLRHPLSISSRDLRQLDLHASKTSEPFVAVRFGVILLKLELYRALILRDRMYLLVELGADGELDSVLSNLSSLTTGKLPFEFLCLDLLLGAVVDHNRHQLTTRQTKIDLATKVLEDKSSSRSTSGELDRLREIKVELGAQLQSLQRLDNALDDVIDDENELTFMQLTRYHDSPDEFFDAMLEPSIPRHLFEGTEAQIEDHLQEVSEIVAQLEIQQQRINTWESTITFALDERRNQLLAISTMLNIATSLFAAGGLVAGLFGMNLTNGNEGSEAWFNGVVAAVMAVILVGFVTSTYAMLKAGLFRM
eukprot:m.37576 g.37576  ORF g.37576 m.37576 type:complete len:424 (+) comp12519_c0_seq1:91-1362(+)